MNFHFNFKKGWHLDKQKSHPNSVDIGLWYDKCEPYNTGNDEKKMILGKEGCVC